MSMTTPDTDSRGAASASSPASGPPSSGISRLAQGLAHVCMVCVLCAWSLLILIPVWLLAPPALALQKWHYRPKWAALARHFITGYGRGMLFLWRPWMPVLVQNADLARATGPCIIVANHQSSLDPYLLGAQTEANLCLVSKTWPYRLLFFFAPAMRLAGYVDVESLPALAAEEICLRRLREGATLVFFPEGRRTRDGALGRFYAGAFALAVKANVPVVPLLIHNSRAVFPAGGRFFTPAPVHMRMLPAQHPTDFAHADLPHRALMRSVRNDFVQHLQKSMQGA